jgi:zinc transporter ZupT
VVKLQQNDGSVALIIAAVWTGIVHLGLGVLGTFVLKRFPTSFSVGFLLGVLVVLANQNLILFSTFSSYAQGSPRTNHVFASLGFTLFTVLAFMALLLLHFKQDVVVTPMDGNDEDEAEEEVPTPAMA